MTATATDTRTDTDTDADAGETETIFTPETFAEAMEATSGTLEEVRWERARLARQGRDQHEHLRNLPNWAEIAANCKSVSRSKRRVRDWVDIVDFYDLLPRKFSLTFSHYDTARRYVKRLDLETIMDALYDAEQTCSTVESMGEYLRDAAREPEPPFGLADELAELHVQLEALKGRAEYLDGRDEPTRQRDMAAVDRLIQAVDCEQSRLARRATQKAMEA